MLLSASDMPEILRRPHIHTGYRPLNQPHHYYYKSAFRKHNEVVNVWSHFLPLFYLILVYVVPELSSANPRFPVLILHFGTFILLVGSSTAHLLHSRSQMDHIFWILIDFAGIAVFALSIGLQRFGCQDDMHPWVELFYLPTLLLVAIVVQFLSTCTLFVLKPLWPHRSVVRATTCLILALWLYVPIVHRYFGDEDEELHHHNRAFQWLVVSGIFMNAHVPERFAPPGIFDLVGYGHQLFHLCVIMVSWNLLEAAQTDCHQHISSWGDMRNVMCAGTILFGGALIAHTIYSLMHKAKGKYE